MSIQKVVVDTESYQWVPGGSLTVQGWKAVEGESAAILVLDEKGEPVKAEVKILSATGCGKTLSVLCGPGG